MRRFVDRGAVTAAWVGVGMAVTIGVSYLVIPIEPLFLYSPILAGLLIGYYADARSERTGGPWPRILANSLFAGVVTGVTFAILLLAIKGLFFNVDNGYRDASTGGSLTCRPGADCVYRRYLASDQGADLPRAGVTDVSTFTAFYWGQQTSSAGGMLMFSTVFALAGGFVFGVSNRRKPGEAGTAATTAG
jgi:hypothetical protein